MKEWHDGTSQSRIQGKSNETKQKRGCVIYLFVPQILTELLFCARHCASDWVRSEQTHRRSWGLLRRRDKKHPLGKYLSVKHKEENEKEVDRRHSVGGGDHKLTTKCPVTSSIKKWHWMKTKEGKEVEHELGKSISNRVNGKNRAQRSSKETSEARTRVWAGEAVRELTGGQVIHGFMKTVEIRTFSLNETGNWAVTRFDLHLNKWLICETT